MDEIAKLLQAILGGGQRAVNFFSAPGNPYDLKSPIPNNQLVTRNLPVGVQSPVPQSGVIQHVQGGSGYQNYQETAANNIAKWVNLFRNGAPTLPQQAVVRQPVRQQVVAPTTMPTPTPMLNDFITTRNIPEDYKQLIYQAAQQYKIHPALIASTLFSEHGFSRDPGYNYNTNGTYDRGPAQINSAAHPEITDKQALDLNFAIPWLAKTVAGHIKNLGPKRGIVAYNTGGTGASNVSKPEEHPYYQKVTSGLSPKLRGELGL
ncbi:hypothetical protein M1437_03245 [Patescibacteria group bacterium]|nr:hypothetical protein [Patescibacteria group bacterium]